MSKSHQCWESCCGHTLRPKIWTLAVSTRTQPQRQRCPKIWTLAVCIRTQPQRHRCPKIWTLAVCIRTQPQRHRCPKIWTLAVCIRTQPQRHRCPKIWTLAVSIRTQPQRHRCPKIWTLAISTRTQPERQRCPKIWTLAVCIRTQPQRHRCPKIWTLAVSIRTQKQRHRCPKIWTLAVSSRTQPQRHRRPKIWTLAVSTRTQPQRLLCPQNSSYYFVTSPYLSVLGIVLLQKLTLTQLQLFPSTHSYRTVHISRVCNTFGLITSHHKACSFKNKWWFVMPKRVAKPLTHGALCYCMQESVHFWSVKEWYLISQSLKSCSVNESNGLSSCLLDSIPRQSNPVHTLTLFHTV